MYCIECGAQIPDSSKFCQHCGKSQLQGEQSVKEQIAEAIIHRDVQNEIVKVRETAKGFTVLRKMIGWYLAWVVLNLSVLLIFSDAIFTDGSDTDAFFPFGSAYNNGIEEYDIREFLVYTLLPLAVLIIIGLVRDDETTKTQITSNANEQKSE